MLVELAKKWRRCQPRLIGTDQQRQILGHVAGLDGVDADALDGARESCDLGRVVELGTVFAAAGPGEDRRDRVGRGLLALLVLAVVAGPVIRRENVYTPVPNAPLACRLLLGTKK